MSRKALAALLAAIALAGCGGSDDEPEAAPTPAPTETVDELPKLAEGWRPHFNRAGGFAFALPRGWTADDRSADSLIRSFDRLVAISITPDRSPEGLAVGIEDYATRAAKALPGFRGGLFTESPQPFEHRYEGVELRAEGTAKGGVKEEVSAIVLRRDATVTFTVVIAANARPAAMPSVRLAERVVESLRSRPPREEGGDGG